MDIHFVLARTRDLEPGPVIVGLVIGSLILAVFVRAGAAWGAKAEVPFGKAFAIAFLASIAVGVVRFAARSQQGVDPVMQYAAVPVLFFVLWGLLVAMAKLESGKAAIAALVTTGIMLALGVVIVLIVVGTAGG